MQSRASITPASGYSPTLGTEAAPWSAVYATTIVGDLFVRATVAAAGGSGGATAGTLTVTLTRLDGSAVTSARQVYVATGANQYEVGQGVSTLTFGSATTGSKIAGGNGWVLLQTSTAGVAAVATSNSADGTVYFAAWTPIAGVSTASTASIVVSSNSDDAVWAA